MYKIDSVIRNPDSNEVTVVCENERFHITGYDCEKLGISENGLIDEDVYSALTEARERLACIKKAFDFLSYGDLTKRQLRDKLARKFPRGLCDDVADLFEERGYINDARLAERYAETFYEFKNMGLGKIREQLYRRGISREDIDNALSKYENEDQYDRIREYIAKKYDTSMLTDDKYRRKVYSGLMRAGFSSGDIADVLRNFESE